jgi:hypothetical protein
MTALAILGFVFGAAALAKVNRLEKKLEQFDLVPRNLDPSNKP